jgi:ribonucleoside-diphosphate reductase alpha chain
MDIASKILSDITVHMKYAKYLPVLKRRETWEELVDRNKKMHIKKFPQLKDEINEAYKLVYERKILPSMRSMQFAGKSIEISPNRVYNCAYAPVDDWRVFSEIMFLLLGGTGVGISVQKHHVECLPEIRKPNPERTRRYLIGDSIEGWADAIKILMKSYFGYSTSTPIFDYSDIRPKGALLVTSGGKAPGPQPLKDCVHNIEKMLGSKKDGDKLSPIETHDIICHIADSVLAGGIRRAALISLFSFDDEEMMSCKFGNWWELNPQRGRANNSVVLLRHKVTKEDFDGLWRKIEESGSGEPGLYFSNDKDWGCNPCCEIGLRPFTFCNLVEVNVSDVDSQEELNKRVRAAAFIGTLQAGYTEFHYLREIWQRNTEKDALIGVGMTGIASGSILKLNLIESSNIVKTENARVADIIGINHAARTTTIKPSGSSSLVLGTSSGIHGWHNDYYIRRVRVGKNEAIYQYLLQNHPALVEDEFFRPHDTAVIIAPQKAPENAIYRYEKPLKLLERVKKFNLDWVRGGHRNGQNTNNVSVTISIKKEFSKRDDSGVKTVIKNEWPEVGEWMWLNRDTFNGISVLPYDGGNYIQAPFTNSTKDEYNKLMENLFDVDLTKVIEIDDNTNLSGELSCSGGACEIDIDMKKLIKK